MYGKCYCQNCIKCDAIHTPHIDCIHWSWCLLKNFVTVKRRFHKSSSCFLDDFF